MAEKKTQYVSCRSGGGLYELEPDMDMVTVFGTPRPTITHILSGAQCYMVPCDAQLQNAVFAHIEKNPFRYPLAYRSRMWEWKVSDIVDDAPLSRQWMADHFWDYLIERPPRRDLFVWPVDVVSIRKGHQLVFPVRETAMFHPMTQRLANINDRPRPQYAWDAVMHDHTAVPFITGVLNLWDALDHMGYINGGFRIDRLYYDDADASHIICDFSQSLVCTDALPHIDGPDGRSTVTLMNQITGEYMDPYRYAQSDGRTVVVDKYSERFTLAAMLFRLLIGRMPYDGRAVEPDWATNTDAQMHDVWVRQYQHNPVFIFDPDDASNSVGGENAPESDRHFVDNWQRLDAKTREMFVSVFRTENAMRTATDRVFPDAQTWRRLLAPQISSR